MFQWTYLPHVIPYYLELFRDRWCGMHYKGTGMTEFLIIFFTLVDLAVDVNLDTSVIAQT